MRNLLAASVMVLILLTSAIAFAQMPPPTYQTFPPMHGDEKRPMMELMAPPPIPPDEFITTEIKESMRTIIKLLRRIDSLMNERLESRDISEIAVIMGDISWSLKVISEIYQGTMAGDMETMRMKQRLFDAENRLRTIWSLYK